MRRPLWAVLTATVALAPVLLLPSCGAGQTPAADPGMNATPSTRTSTPITSGHSPSSSTPTNLATSPGPTAAVSAPPQADLVDERTQAFAEVDLDPTSSTLGGVRLGIPGVGLLWTAGNATISGRTHDSATFHYDGNGQLDPRARLDLEFGGVISQVRGPVHHVSLRLDGAIHAGVGHVDVWVDGRHYSLDATAVPHDADQAAATIVDALADNDWAALYPLTDSDTKSALSQAVFVGKMSAAGRVAEIRITGPITYKVVASGVSYATVPVFERVIARGRPTAGNGTIVLIRENGEWSFFTSTEGGA